ncbi:GntR family transcriptional regulator [Novosphingobium profundi]|uniref:GntR family transcriptional regulator n=1 Tax=Novosphingobium profundi TaxID=1774954 RepID=UPI001BDB0176|nr:GntR family transcriptional regulator [Novosphingobium profundi]MBT0667398.1 GntR family transcriptional regulator [Novosphingobium profundi]
MIYRALKADYAAGAFSPGRRLDVQELADRHRSSKTPVREALCRLMGEGLIEPHPEGGMQLVRYSAHRLVQLYAWNMSLLLGLVREIRLSALRRAVEESAERIPQVTPVGISQAVGAAFLSLAAASGNPFALQTIGNLNDRLHYVRIEEVHDLAEAAKEVAILTNLSVRDLPKNMRRRLESYHMRRIDRHRGDVSDRAF